MIERFEVGHWYRYSGKIAVDMVSRHRRSLCDGKPHLCTEIDSDIYMHEPLLCRFADCDFWYDWGGDFNHWEDITYLLVSQTIKNILETP